jgi:hypothetical protein
MFGWFCGATAYQIRLPILARRANVIRSFATALSKAGSYCLDLRRYRLRNEKTQFIIVD